MAVREYAGAAVLPSSTAMYVSPAVATSSAPLRPPMVLARCLLYTCTKYHCNNNGDAQGTVREQSHITLHVKTSVSSVG